MSGAQADKGTEERSRDRSPPFPFIPLEKAIARARELEAQYKRSAGRVPNVLAVWNYTPKSSGGAQTIGALKAFGLLEDEGSGPDRKVKLTELALRILKDERPGKREEAVQEAALKPKPIAEHWALWGPSRPPDAECRSELTLERGYPEEAAVRFLRVYDDTVAYAQLAQADSISDEREQDETPVNQQTLRGPEPAARRGSFIPDWVGQQQSSSAMPERIVFAQEIEPPQAIKLLVTGPVDEAVLDALDDFVQFQRLRLKRTKRTETPPAEPQSAGEDEALES